MKICHMTSAHDSTDVRIFEKECTSLAKKSEYQVCLVASGESYNKNNVSVVGVGEKPSGRIKRAFSHGKKIYKRALELDADIYHLHDPELLRFVSKLKRRGKKVIYDSHEDTIEDISRKEYIPKALRNLITLIFKRFINRAASKVDAVITVTPQIVEKYEPYCNKVYLVTNYPIISNVIEGKNEKTVTKNTVLCFAGGIAPMWSHENAIDAVEEIEGTEYWLFGKGEDQYIESLKQKAGWKSVKYYGRVPFSVVDKELWNGDIGLALLQYIRKEDKTGTLGNTKLFEMMLHKMPVIATDFTLWKDIVEYNNCGICVNPNHVDEIKQAIIHLIENPEKAKAMGENGHKAIIESYNWQTQEKVLYDVYMAI